MAERGRGLEAGPLCERPGSPAPHASQDPRGRLLASWAESRASPSPKCRQDLQLAGIWAAFCIPLHV